MNFRPRPFYFLTDVSDEWLSDRVIRRSVEALERSGFGGAVLFNKPPRGFTREEFLGPRWFSCIRRFAECARDRQLDIWINDGFDFPPGDGAGRIEAAAPELKQRYLVLSDAGEVEERIADWGFPAFEEPRSRELFIELVYEPHKRELGDLFGHGIVGFFSDADNRRVAHGRFEQMGRRHYYPWSRQFSRLFLKRFGYAVEPHLKDILLARPVEAARDYWLLAGELYQEWFAGNYRWCVANGLEYTFHSSDMALFDWDRYPRSATFTEGDYLHQGQFATWPGTDHELTYLDSCFGCRSEALTLPAVYWGGRTPALAGGEQYRRVRGDTRAKLAQSAAYLYRKPGAMCEMFAATNWSATPAVLRDIAAWQIMQGINFIVPHAWHHRLWGVTKFFAPPDFSPHNNWSCAMRELNDSLAEWCRAASRGELTAPVALLMPTRELWLGRGDANRYFFAAEALNRMPHGYVAVTPERLLDAGRHFDYAVNAGCELSEAFRARAAAAGTAILEAEELDRLPPVAGCRWHGSGRPHFMRRSAPEGAVLLLANIEDDVPIEGTLEWCGRSFAVALEPGEIAWWTPEESHCRRPQRFLREIRLPEVAAVDWHTPNIIPLARWESPGGEALPADTAEREMIFRWETTRACPAPVLLLPREWDGLAAVECDGVGVTGWRECRVLDDEYRSCELPGGGAPGLHRLRLVKDAAKAWPCQAVAYLRGDFDVDLGIAGPPVGGWMQYLWETRIPRYAEVRLSPRRRQLRTDLSWSEQGQPFYSGMATYACDIEVPAAGRWCLCLPRCAAVAEAELDGVSLGSRIWSPYRWALPEGGTGRLRVAVRNTLANQLEGYRAESGLTGGWKLAEYL